MKACPLEHCKVNLFSFHMTAFTLWKTVSMSLVDSFFLWSNTLISEKHIRGRKA